MSIDDDLSTNVHAASAVGFLGQDRAASPSSAATRDRSADGPGADGPRTARRASSEVVATEAMASYWRLLAAVRAGSIHLVVILARWNGHAATRTVQRACRRAGIRAIVVR